MPDHPENEPDRDELPEAPALPADLVQALQGIEDMAIAATLASTYYDELVSRGFHPHAALHMVTEWQTTFFRTLYESNLDYATRPKEPHEHRPQEGPGRPDPPPAAPPQT